MAVGPKTEIDFHTKDGVLHRFIENSDPIVHKKNDIAVTIVVKAMNAKNVPTRCQDIWAQIVWLWIVTLYLLFLVQSDWAQHTNEVEFFELTPDRNEVLKDYCSSYFVLGLIFPFLASLPLPAIIERNAEVKVASIVQFIFST